MFLLARVGEEEVGDGVEGAGEELPPARIEATEVNELRQVAPDGVLDEPLLGDTRGIPTVLEGVGVAGRRATGPGVEGAG